MAKEIQNPTPEIGPGHVPLHNKPAKARALHYEFMTSPANSQVYNAELAEMYSNALRILGFTEDQAEEATEQFRREPLDFNKIDKAHTFRNAADAKYVREGELGK